MIFQKKQAVHPRLRGELLPAGPHQRRTGGSSPLTRGTHEVHRQVYVHPRFIPAYAGNSKKVAHRAFLEPVHPRLRGELNGTPWANSIRDGSSPLTRGTLYPHLYPPSGNRFIPAYAGNSTKRGPGRRSGTVHPRLRGELTGTAVKFPIASGSSPLTRGTHNAPDNQKHRCRFIPAYAGNSIVS